MVSSLDRSRALVGLAGVLLVSGVLWIGVRTDFLPCTLDCGETYEAYVGARNLDRFGWGATAGLQDFAAGTDPAAHPALYTHNPNLGMYVLAGLFALGIRDVHAQTPWLLLPFLLGMLYLYGAVRLVGGNRLLAACCLLQAAGSYLLVLLWAFDAVRVWSWLLTFALVYHLARWARSASRGHLAIAALALALSIGIDYPFAVFLSALVLALAWLRVIPLRVPVAILLVVAAVGGAVVLRQGQVVAAIGPELWWADLTTTLLRRVPLLALVVSMPDPQPLADARHLVVWQGGEGAPQPLTWAWRLGRAYTAVLGWPLLVLGAIWGWALRHPERVDGRLQPALRLSLAVGLALVATFAVFAQYVTAFYGVFLMPLVVHWLVLLLGLATAALLLHWRATVRWRRVTLPVGLLLLVVFVGWRVGTEVRNVVTLPPAGYPARAVLAELRGRSVATLWISSAPAAYTDEWAAALRTTRWLVFGTRPIVFDPVVEYDTFFQRDRDNPVYRHPEFILVPRLNTFGLARTCRPLDGAIYAFADGCSSLDLPTTRPVWRRGADYVIYETRDLGTLARSN